MFDGGLYTLDGDAIDSVEATLTVTNDTKKEGSNSTVENIKADLTNTKGFKISGSSTINIGSLAYGESKSVKVYLTPDWTCDFENDVLGLQTLYAVVTCEDETVNVSKDYTVSPIKNTIKSTCKVAYSDYDINGDSITTKSGDPLTAIDVTLTLTNCLDDGSTPNLDSALKNALSFNQTTVKASLVKNNGLSFDDDSFQSEQSFKLLFGQSVAIHYHIIAQKDALAARFKNTEEDGEGKGISVNDPITFEISAKDIDYPLRTQTENIHYTYHRTAIQMNLVYDTELFCTQDGFFGEKSSVSDTLEIYYEIDIDSKLDASSLKPIKVTAETDNSMFEIKEKTAEFKNPKPGDKLSEIILLQPSSSYRPGNHSCKVKIKAESEAFNSLEMTAVIKTYADEDRAVQEHINFIDSNLTYRTFRENVYGNKMKELKTDKEYQYSRFLSLDFKNYYDIVFADLMTAILHQESKNPVSAYSFVKRWVGNYKTIISLLNKTVFVHAESTSVTLDSLAIEKYFKASKYTENGLHTEDVAYQLVVKCFGNTGNIDKITKTFSYLDKADQFIGFVKIGVGAAKDVNSWVNKISLYHEYCKSDEALKKNIQRLYNKIPASETKMREAVKQYLDYDSGGIERANAFFDSVVDMEWKIGKKAFSAVVGGTLAKAGSKALISWIGTFKVVEGAKTVAFSETAKFASATSAISTALSVAGGVTTGFLAASFLSDVLCNTGTTAAEIAKIVAFSEYSQYVVDNMVDAENQLKNGKTLKDLEEFEFAFVLHRQTQSFIFEHLIKSIEAKQDSIIVKWIFGNGKYQDDIAYALDQKNRIDSLWCHGSTVVESKVLTVRCPVDVLVTDSAGDTVIKIVNDSIESATVGVLCYIVDHEKYILVPANMDYDITITATDSGTMSYDVYEIDINGNMVHYGKEGISLTKGQIFNGNVESGSAETSQAYILKTDGKTITVSEIPTESVGLGKLKSVSLDDITLNYKSTNMLNPTITADEGVTYTVKYESSNPKVATVDQNGKVTATKRGSGSATITCTVTDEYGNVVKDTCKVDVKLSFGQWLIVILLFGWIWY